MLPPQAAELERVLRQLHQERERQGLNACSGAPATIPPAAVCTEGRVDDLVYYFVSGALMNLIQSIDELAAEEEEEKSKRTGVARVTGQRSRTYGSVT